MCKRQLTNVPQPLKNRCIDDFHFGFIEIDETVDRISYFLHLHSSNQTNEIRFLARSLYTEVYSCLTLNIKKKYTIN